MLRNLLLSKDQSYDAGLSRYIRQKTKKLLRPSKITGELIKQNFGFTNYN